MSVRERVGVMSESVRPVSLVGLLPERAEARRRLGEWLDADPAEVERAAPSTSQGDDWVSLAASLNRPGSVVLVDSWAASQAG